jgi:hypothetical protein
MFVLTNNSFSDCALDLSSQISRWKSDNRLQVGFVANFSLLLS